MIYMNRVKYVISYFKLIKIKLLHPFSKILLSKKNSIGKKFNIIADKGSKVTIGEGLGIRNNVIISVRNNACVDIGNNVFINNNCQIVSHERIVIGNNVKIGPNVMIFDHDYDYVNNGLKKKKYKCEPIIIGDNTWIGAGCILLRGTKIGNNCVVGAGTVLKGEFESNKIIFQKSQLQIKEIEYLEEK